MIQIPTSELPWQEFSIVLDNQNCTIRLRQIAERLYCDLEIDNEIIFEGNLVCNRTDIELYNSPRFHGHLFFVDMLGDTDPVYIGLNSRYLLCFETEEERNAAKTSVI